MAVRTAIVIPNWNGADWLGHCLESARAQCGVQADIIVVDNASTDGSGLLAAEFGARLVPLPENRGFAAAVNRGIAESESEFVAVVNNDALLHPNWLATLIGALDHLPRHGMATGRVFAAGQAAVLDGTGDALSLGFAAARLGHGRPDGPAYAQERDVLAVSGAAALFRREVFRAVGGFEEEFFAYLEDVDLCLRAQLAGFRARYVPDAIAWHRGSASSGGGSLSPKVAEWITSNQLLLAARYARSRLFMALLPRIITVQLLWAARLWLRGQALAWARGARSAAPRLKRMAAPHLLAGAGAGRLLELLRASEAQIFSDRVPGDRFWRIYFRLFPCSSEAQISESAG